MYYKLRVFLLILYIINKLSLELESEKSDLETIISLLIRLVNSLLLVLVYNRLNLILYYLEINININSSALKETSEDLKFFYKVK